MRRVVRLIGTAAWTRSALGSSSVIESRISPRDAEGTGSTVRSLLHILLSQYFRGRGSDEDRPYACAGAVRPDASPVGVHPRQEASSSSRGALREDRDPVRTGRRSGPEGESPRSAVHGEMGDGPRLSDPIPFATDRRTVARPHPRYESRRDSV